MINNFTPRIISFDYTDHSIKIFYIKSSNNHKQNKMFHSHLLACCCVLMFDVDSAAVLLFLELTHFLELEYKQINNHWKRRGTLENHRRLVFVQNFCKDCMKCDQLGLSVLAGPSGGAGLIPTVGHSASPFLQRNKTDEQHQGYVREDVGCLTLIIYNLIYNLNSKSYTITHISIFLRWMPLIIL